ncbi:MAG: DUF4350 domain-containing protein [Pseudomonadota bacterium]
MSARPWLIAVLLAVLTGAAGYWFYRNFELVSDKVQIGYQGEARDNPLLAASRFLNTRSSPALSMPSLTGLPPTGATLVMPGERYEMGPQQAAQFLGWVRAGGHLIVIPADTENEKAQDWLLDGLGVRRVNNPAKSREPFVPTNVDIPAASDFMQVTFKPCTTLEYRNPKTHTVMVGDMGGHLLRYRLGAGDLTVLSDADFMRNSSIGRYDNAAFLWYLTHPQREGEIWLIYSGDMPPLWKWLGMNAWTVLVSAAALLIAWLWSSSRGLGPKRAMPSLARRRLLDHIVASGRFLWQQGQRAKLLNGTRAALLRMLESRHPALASLSPAALAIHLAELSKTTPDTIQKILFNQYAPNETEFTEAIILLETIRKKL